MSNKWAGQINNEHEGFEIYSPRRLALLMIC